MNWKKMITVIMVSIFAGTLLQGCQKEKDKQDETREQIESLYDAEKAKLEEVMANLEAQGMSREAIEKRVGELVAEGKSYSEIIAILEKEGVPKEVVANVMDGPDTNTRPTVSVEQ